MQVLGRHGILKESSILLWRIGNGSFLGAFWHLVLPFLAGRSDNLPADGLCEFRKADDACRDTL